MDNEKMKRKVKFMTIREVAATGLLAEMHLRRMKKEGKLPCIYAGSKCLINYYALLEQLDEESRKNVR